MTSNVYFFQHNTLPLVKIGKADDWAIRALQVGGVELIDFDRSMFKEVADSTTAYDLERMLHVLFENRRVPDPTGLSGGTEWFCETVMGEVRRVVRGLSTCDGSRVVRKSKARIKSDTVGHNLKKSIHSHFVTHGTFGYSAVTDMQLPELTQIVSDNCITKWVEQDLHVWTTNHKIKSVIGTVMDRLTILTNSVGYDIPRNLASGHYVMRGCPSHGFVANS